MKRWLWLLVVALSACGASTESTRRTFPVEVTGVVSTAATEEGWVVSLTSATASLQSARFYTGKVLISRFDPWSLLVSSAWAHPGHYHQGDALGEVLTPVELDLLSGSQSWGTANAVTGSYGSMQLTFGMAGVRLTGTATKGAQSVRFDTGAFTPPSPIEGIRFDKEMDTSAGKASVAINLATLVERVDFAAAGTPDASGLVVFDAQGPTYNGFARGILDTATYVVTWEQQP